MLLFHAFSFKSISTETVNSSRGGNTAHSSASHYLWLSAKHTHPMNKEQRTTGYQLVFNK